MFPQRPRPTIAACLAISVTLALLALLILLLPTRDTHAQTQPEALGSLRGVVRNAQGEALPDITVNLQHYVNPGEVRQVTSDATGSYAFLSLPSGTYILQFSDPSAIYATQYYVAAHFSIDATTVNVNGNNVTDINMTMAPAGAISLTLQSNTPVTTTSYSVRLFRKTQSNRWFVYRTAYPELGVPHALFGGLPAGNYRLCASTNSYDIVYRSSTECYDNTVPDSVEDLAPNALDINVQSGQTRHITVDFDDTSQIQGTILAPNGTPLSGIPVVLIDEYYYNHVMVTSDADGRFHLPFVPRGLYDMYINLPGYGSSNEYLVLYYPNADTPSGAQRIEIDSNTHISSTFRLRLSARITGKVTLPDNVPVAWATPMIYRQGPDGSFNFADCYTVCTPYPQYDPISGVYTVTHLVAGTYRIGVSYYVPNTQSSGFQFYGGDSLDQADNIQVGSGATIRNINFEVGEGDFDGVFTGRVTASGQPAAGIEVGLFLPNYYLQERSAMPYFTTQTDDDGRYALEGIAMGYYHVGTRDPKGQYATSFYNEGVPPPEIFAGQVPAATIWHTGTGTIDNIDIELSPGATIRGHMRLQNKPRGDIVVQLAQRTMYYNDPYYGPILPYADIRTDANGFYEITGIVSGTYRLRAYEPASNGDYYGQPLFYPGTYDGYATEIITLTTGQTRNGMDFWLYTTPTYYLPALENGPATDTPPNENPPMPPPTATPMFPAPPPTPTPVAVPAR